jgi:hypothetical protein
MNTQAAQPPNTSNIPSISKNTRNGDLYCSKAHPINNMNVNMTTTKVMIIGMSL